MKYYSETLGKLFDSEKELEEAETLAIKEEAEKKEKAEAARKERAEDAKAVEEALKAVKLAEDDYYEKLNAFIKKYGSYHYTSKDIKDFPSVFSVFEPFFSKWF